MYSDKGMSRLRILGDSASALTKTGFLAAVSTSVSRKENMSPLATFVTSTRSTLHLVREGQARYA